MMAVNVDLGRSSARSSRGHFRLLGIACPENGMVELARTASLRPKFETRIIVIRVVTGFSTHSH